MIESDQRLLRELDIHCHALDRLDWIHVMGPVQPGTTGVWRWVRTTLPHLIDPTLRTLTWCLYVDTDFPYGDVQFQPAKVNGLQGTRAHQNPNQDLWGMPWTAGNPCLVDPLASLKSRHARTDPIGDKNRLVWYAERLRAWLELAAANQLQPLGARFERPRFHHSKTGETIAYYAEPDAWALWQPLQRRIGTCRLGRLTGPTDVHYVHGFQIDGRIIPTPACHLLRPQAPTARGTWIVCPDLPILPPFQAPFLIGDLSEILEGHGVSFAEVMESVYRKPDEPTPLLLGYPMSERVGDPPTALCWEALTPPPLSRTFRLKLRTRRQRVSADWRSAFGAEVAERPLNWMVTENWAPTALRARGSLSESLRMRSVFLIGTGCVGSEIAESLVRGGVSQLTTCDGDRLRYGNLARHTLTAQEVGEDKAFAVAQRLIRVNPFAQILNEKKAFSARTIEEIRQLPHDSVIIDCTGAEPILAILGNGTWKPLTWFVSVSLSNQARWLYLFIARADEFPARAMEHLLMDFEREHTTTLDADDLPMEGAGCWHPLFQARRDQVAALVNLAVHEIDLIMAADERTPTLIVIGRKDDVPCSGIDIVRRFHCTP